MKNRMLLAAIGRARRLCPQITEPRETDNLLIVAFAGRGSQKSQMGEYKEILLILPGPTQTHRIEVSTPWFGERPAYAAAARTDDMGFQATTRGGRLVDEINKRKASTKRVTNAAGDVAVGAGAATLLASDSDDAAIAGAALLATGIVLKSAAAAMQTQADIRAIPSVPGFVHLWAGRILPGDQILAVRLLDRGGNCLREQFQEVHVPYASTHNIAYVWCP